MIIQHVQITLFDIHFDLLLGSFGPSFYFVRTHLAWQIHRKYSVEINEWSAIDPSSSTKWIERENNKHFYYSAWKSAKFVAFHCWKNEHFYSKLKKTIKIKLSRRALKVFIRLTFNDFCKIYGWIFACKVFETTVTEQIKLC